MVRLGIRCLGNRCLLHFLGGVVLLLEISTAASDGLSLKSRVAVIGGGISGTFVTKYLVDYNKDLCTLEALDIFDPVAQLGQELELGGDQTDDWQGSRVANIRLSDGRVVEVGASIGHTSFRYVLEMIENDPRNITIGKPFATGRPEWILSGLGIYDGEGQWPLLTSNQSDFFTKHQLLWRYHFDLWKVTREARNAEYFFENIHDNLEEENALFQEPDDIWKSVGLDEFAHESFDSFISHLYFLSKSLDFWKSSEFLRKELLTAINLCNYNQNNAQVNALVGLASFATSTAGNLFSIVGGNSQVVDSAFHQAKANYEKKCPQQKDSVVRHVSQRVTKVVARASGGKMDLYGPDDELLGTYDVVILAAPLQMSRITFLQQSHVDSSVVTPMPLGGLVQPRIAKQVKQGGNSLMPTELPSFAKRPYIQVVTTVVSGATLNTTYFQLPSRRQPRSMFVTESGKATLFNITVILQITGEGVYKIFSNERLAPEILVMIFGPTVKVEIVKVWGGPHGGATPDFQGQGSSLSFTLYRDGLDKKSVLYYVNAIEGAFACMENSAIGAKAVAKLVANELGWISVPEPAEAVEEEHDEL